MKPEHTTGGWIGKQAAAEYLGVSTRTIDRLVTARKLRVGRIGRRVVFQRAELDRVALSGDGRSTLSVR
ncbi:MAG: helix-turn-helix domain-containing protein [Phycisphaerales bacterium]